MYCRLLDSDNADDFGSVSLENIVSTVGSILFVALIFSLVNNVVKYFGGGLNKVGNSICDSIASMGYTRLPFGWCSK